VSMSKSPAETGREIFEKEDAADRELAKRFDPKRILQKASEIRTLDDPVLGNIKYTILTTGDLFKLDKISDKEERARMTIFLLLHKAYPDMKEQDIDGFPGEVTTRLCELIAGPDNFFQIPQVSKTGSESTITPNSLAS
jgi:hypothetical protein